MFVRSISLINSVQQVNTCQLGALGVISIIIREFGLSLNISNCDNLENV